MGERQLEEIARTGERVPHVDIVSPTTGIVIPWNIFPAPKFAEGTEFFRIADLGKTDYYCSDECKAKFDENPQKYSELAASPAPKE